MERVPGTVHGTELPTYAVTPLHGRNPFVVVSGRLPSRADEIALGPASAAALHRHVGDHLRLRIDQHRPVTVTVTGLALLPQTPHSSFDQGAATTPAGLTRATGLRARARYDSVGRMSVVASYRRAPARSIHGLRRRTGVEVDPIAIPQDVLNLRNVRALPRALSGFLVLLGMAALGHALVTAVRRRRHELAILRAIGFTPRQTAVSVAASAGTVGLVGLAVGIPLGIVLGRLAWRWVADSTPLVFVAPVAITVVVLAIPVTLAIANLLAAAPARHASRIRPAAVLRTE